MRKFDVRSDVLSSVQNCHTALDEIEDRTPLPRLPVVPGHQVVGRSRRWGRARQVEFWQVIRTRAVGRTAAGYAAALHGLIGAARQVVIVEPVFNPQEPRFTPALEAVASLEPIPTGKVTPCLIVRMDERTPTADELEQRCRLYLPRHLHPTKSCYARLGLLDKARATIARLRAITPDVMVNRDAHHRELFSCPAYGWR